MVGASEGTHTLASAVVALYLSFVFLLLSLSLFVVFTTEFGNNSIDAIHASYLLSQSEGCFYKQEPRERASTS